MWRLAAADPGTKGAIAFGNIDPLTGTLSELSVYDMPLSCLSGEKEQPDEVGMFEIIHTEKPGMAVLEHLTPRPQGGPAGRGGKVQEWGTSGNYAAIRSAFRIHFHLHKGEPAVHLVRPNIWKGKFELGNDKYASLEMARSLFPEVGDRLKLKKNEGRAEALLLLEYYRRFVFKANSVEVC